MTETTTECVYVIGSTDSHFVKIGRTVDLEARLAGIQRMGPMGGHHHPGEGGTGTAPPGRSR